MKDQPKDSGLPVGDPPPRTPPLKADHSMRDPFTDQTTRPAGEGQGANRPQPRHEDDDQGRPLEEGFTPVP